MKFRIILWMLLVVCPVQAGAPASFSEAKRVVSGLYDGDQGTFYCGCQFRGKTIDPVSCGYTPRKQAQRGARLEWEHIVPAWEIGHQRQCWQKGGRRNCERTDAAFARMTGDLHNLVPSVGELNGDRSNYRFGMITGEPRAYGRCDFEVDFKARVAEPATDRQGDVARIYFYMRDTYGLRLSRKQTQLFEAWHRSDPVDERERQRDQRIRAVQGSSNCYVSGGC